jgi:hypothetical protein
MCERPSKRPGLSSSQQTVEDQAFGFASLSGQTKLIDNRNPEASVAEVTDVCNALVAVFSSFATSRIGRPRDAEGFGKGRYPISACRTAGN